MPNEVIVNHVVAGAGEESSLLELEVESDLKARISELKIELQKKDTLVTLLVDRTKDLQSELTKEKQEVKEMARSIALLNFEIDHLKKAIIQTEIVTVLDLDIEAEAKRLDVSARSQRRASTGDYISGSIGSQYYVYRRRATIPPTAEQADAVISSQQRYRIKEIVTDLIARDALMEVDCSASQKRSSTGDANLEQETDGGKTASRVIVYSRNPKEEALSMIQNNFTPLRSQQDRRHDADHKVDSSHRTAELSYSGYYDDSTLDFSVYGS